MITVILQSLNDHYYLCNFKVCPHVLLNNTFQAVNMKGNRCRMREVEFSLVRSPKANTVSKKELLVRARRLMLEERVLKSFQKATCFLLTTYTWSYVFSALIE